MLHIYQWMEPSGKLRRRWDNTPHWPEIATAPHHVHIVGKDEPEPSTVTNIEDLLRFIEDWLETPTQLP